MKLFGFLILFVLVVGCSSVQPVYYIDGDAFDTTGVHKRLVASAARKASLTDIVMHIDDFSVDQYRSTIVPVVMIAPRYPVENAKQGTVGWVIVEYTIDHSGKPVDVVVIENSGTDVFNSSAISAASKALYFPPIVGENIVAVKGVRKKFTFQLEE